MSIDEIMSTWGSATVAQPVTVGSPSRRLETISQACGFSSLATALGRRVHLAKTGNKLMLHGTGGGDLHTNRRKKEAEKKNTQAVGKRAKVASKGLTDKQHIL